MAWRDAFSRSCFAPQYFQGLEQRRGGLAPAHRHTDRLEHLPGLDPQAFGGGAQRGFQAVVRELRGGEYLARASPAPAGPCAASPFLGISSAGS